MSTEKHSIISRAESEGEHASVTGWYFIGFFLGLIGILIVYLRSPKAPIRLAAEYDGEDRYLLEKAYVEVLKGKQIKATWIGLAISLVLYVIVMVAGMSSMALV